MLVNTHQDSSSHLTASNPAG